MNIPHKFQGVLWSANINSLDTQQDKKFIVHQILSQGNLEDIKWLLSIYSKKEIIAIFTNAYKNYKKPRFFLIKDALLGLKNWHPALQNYVINTLRITG